MQEKHTNNHFNLCFVEVISSPHKGVVIRGVFLANHLVSTDNLTKTTNKHEHVAIYNTKSFPNKRCYTMNTCKTS